jgi:hypothetical protein
MQLDDLLQRYFATTDLSGVAPDTFAAGIEHCRVDLGLEEDRGKRFALWSFLHMFGSVPFQPCWQLRCLPAPPVMNRCPLELRSCGAVLPCPASLASSQAGDGFRFEELKELSS